MRTLIIHIALFLIGTIHSTVFAQGAPDPDCPVEYFYRGYDFVEGNPADDNTDPGWRSNVMLSKRNDHCLTCDYAESCEDEYIVHEMEGEIDYYNRLYGRVYVSGSSEGFLKSTAFTGSGEYEYQRQDVFGLGLVNIQAEGSCQIFDGSRDPFCYDLTFTPGFLNALAEFPTSTEEPDWFDKVEVVFNTYGTHIIGDYVSLGARWSHESQLTQVSYDALRAADVNMQMAAEASAEFFRTKGGSAEYESDEQTELRLMFDGSAERQRSITVGTKPPEDINFGAWANSIEHPIPQTHSLRPISELLTPKIFPDDPNIELKRAVMEAGYEFYCDSVPGCSEPLPNPPKIIRVSDTEEGKYQTQNSLSVACPANYLLISGGCKSEPEPYEPYYWILPSLKPVGNTYQCIANMDYWWESGHQNYYKGLDGSATCLYKDYIEDVVTIPCEGAIGPYGSECTAYCPSGYQVTGGGCESNFPDDFTPWKVTISQPISADVSGRNGWNCKVAHNYGAEVDDRKAEGYAICVQYAEGTIADHKIISEYSGTAELDTNGAVASCDAGYAVVGGGCRTTSHAYPYYEWKIVESQPSKDKQGWSCLAQRDLGTTTFYQDVRADAVCVLFK